MANQSKPNPADFINADSHLNDEGVSLFSDGLHLEKEALLPQRLKDHVDDCRECKMEIMTLYTAIEGQDVAELGPHPYFALVSEQTKSESTPKARILHADWMRTALRIATAVAVMVAAAWFIFIRGFRTDPQIAENVPQQKIPTAADSTETPQEERIEESIQEQEREPDIVVLYAMNFTESANLEDLVSNPYRSGNVEVDSPANNADVGDTIEFHWTGAPDEALTLIILNNREEALFTLPVTGDRMIFSESLDPGLYYWKLETEDELLYVGKFFSGRTVEKE